MKKSYIATVISISLFFALSTQDSFAEERAGLVKSTWRQFINAFKGKETGSVTEEPEVRVPNAVPKPAPESEKAQGSPFADITAEELIDRIKNILEVSPEVADFVPELKIIKGPKGEISEIQYDKDGVVKPIEELSKETLIRLHSRMNNERTRLQTDRIQRQLNAARAVQNIAKPQVPVMPPRIPKVYVPPRSLPKIPKPPPAPPKIPAPPPRPPEIPGR
ncbi:MAG: hypothetical protein ABID09_06740 [Candidatus Omnitrophota bacterium]